VVVNTKTQTAGPVPEINQCF